MKSVGKHKIETYADDDEPEFIVVEAVDPPSRHGDDHQREDYLEDSYRDKP